MIDSGFSRVTEVLKPYGPDYSKIPPELLAIAQERGTAAHHYCSGIALGIWQPEPDELIRGRVESFRLWFENYVDEVLLVEKRIYCPVHMITGCPDLAVRFKHDPKVVLVDLKTALGVQPTYAGQLAAYKYLIERYEDINIDRLGTLRIREDKPALFDEVTDEGNEAFQAFLCALFAQRFFKERTRRR